MPPCCQYNLSNSSFDSGTSSGGGWTQVGVAKMMVVVVVTELMIVIVVVMMMVMVAVVVMVMAELVNAMVMRIGNVGVISQ